MAGSLPLLLSELIVPRLAVALVGWVDELQSLSQPAAVLPLAQGELELLAGLHSLVLHSNLGPALEGPHSD